MAMNYEKKPLSNYIIAPLYQIINKNGKHTKKIKCKLLSLFQIDE